MNITGYNSVKSWLIAAACSFVQCMVVLPTRVTSMLFVAFVSRYNTDRRSATVFSVTYGVICCLAGPFVGYLAEIFGLRSLIISGCFISSLGLGLCYFADNIVTVTILFGVIYGFGLALGATLMPQILKQHFNKNLANANGFSKAGTSLGIFAIIPVISLLLKQYDVSGALLILSGIMLHGVPVAMLLRDPKYKNESNSAKATVLNGEETHQSVKDEIPEEYSHCSVIPANVATSLSNKDKKKCVKENGETLTDAYLNDGSHDIGMIHNVIENKKGVINENHAITSFNPCIRMQSEKETKQEFNTFPIDVIREDLTNKRVPSSNKCSIKCSDPNKCIKESGETTIISNVAEELQETDMTCNIIQHKEDTYNDNQTTKITFNPSTRHKLERETEQGFSMLSNDVNSRQDLVIAPSSLCKKQNKYKEALKTLLVLKDPTFLAIMFCQSIHAYSIKFIWTTIIEIARDKSIPRDLEQYLLMFAPVAETVGCTCLGWVTDKGYLSVANYIAIGFLFMGFSCFTFVLASNFFTLMVANMWFGLCFSGISIAFPSLIYEFIEEKRHTMAIASRLILYTPLSCTLVPFIGYFRGTLGSYDGALLLLTVVCVGCSVLLALLPYILKCQKVKM